MPVLKGPRVPPFSQESCGLNLMLSEDGYTATRSCGCRESVAIGSAPLERQSRGLYFEVRITKTVEGWIGGLAIGVTHTLPGQLQRIPDKAWRVAGTFIVGYTGCLYLDGSEHRISWRPDTLVEGQRVGVLLTGDGQEDLVIYVDDVEEVRIDGARLHGAGLRHSPLYPIVDVFNATLAITLSAYAAPPSGDRHLG